MFSVNILLCVCVYFCVIIFVYKKKNRCFTVHSAFERILYV
jgi:hypothetical protein